MSKYYVLLERFTGETWAQSFGDYDKETVKDEMSDCKDSGCYRGEIYKVITVNGDTQADIENAIAKENSKLTDLTPAELIKPKNKLEGMELAYNLFDYASADSDRRESIVLNTVADMFPDLEEGEQKIELIGYVSQWFYERSIIKAEKIRGGSL